MCHPMAFSDACPVTRSVVRIGTPRYARLSVGEAEDVAGRAE